MARQSATAVGGRWRGTARARVTLFLRRKGEMARMALQAGEPPRAPWVDTWESNQAVINRIRAFARRAGLRVDGVRANGRSIVLTGTLSALSAAFGVTFRKLRLRGATYRGYRGQPTLPADIEPFVTAILGLDDLPAVMPRARRRPARAATVDDGLESIRGRPGARDRYPVADIGAAYGFPAGLTGKGQCIAVIALGATYDRGDLSTFFGDAMPKIIDVTIDDPPDEVDFEPTCDIEVIGTLAPDARIVVYHAPNTTDGWLHAIQHAVADQKNAPTVISMSYSRYESSDMWSDRAIQAFATTFEGAAKNGITVLGAAGDQADGVDYPAADSHVLACGGSDATIDNRTLNGEGAWENTNGGISERIPAPSWQTPDVVPNRDDGSRGRGVPDVAAHAFPNYDCFWAGKPYPFGGTSGATALWAALIGVINQGLSQPAGFISERLYQLRGAGCRDVQGGVNSHRQAGSGWDRFTGWGSPDGGKLLQMLQGAKGAHAADSRARARPRARSASKADPSAAVPANDTLVRPSGRVSMGAQRRPRRHRRRRHHHRRR